MRSALKELRVHGRALIPRSDAVRRSLMHTSGGLSYVEVDSYDAFGICGLGHGLHVLAEMYGEYRSDDFAGFASARHLVSRDCFEEAVLGSLRESFAVRLAQKIRKVSDAPIYLIPQPLPSETIRSGDSDVAKLWQALLVNEDEERLQALFKRLHGKELVSGLKVVAQAPETLASASTTKELYSHGSKRLLNENEHDGQDFFHMNGAYGAIAMRQLCQRLG
jgi:ribosomal protein L12E/L44/L45/RPP1/RPP2